MSYPKPFIRLAKYLLPAILLALGGCATTPTYTQYGLTSNPPGADIYMGPSPERMSLYKTTPFSVNSPTSLSWSNKYFQARKPGYKDSPVHHQPFFALGTPTTIHFDLQSRGGADELAPYQSTNTLPSYYEFLETYPHSPLKAEVYAAMVLLIAGQDDPNPEYDRLADSHPEAIDSFPQDVRLGYIGPSGMRVGDIAALIQQGMGEAIIEQKILSAGQPYAEFSFDEIRELTAMGLTDKVIAAMLKVTEQNKSKPVREAARPAATPQAAMHGYVPAGSAPAQGESVGDTMAECAAHLAKKEACDQLGGFAGMICMQAIPAGHGCF